MKTISIKTFEEIHHTCLMFGLKQAYLRFPFLAGNILTTPPPIRRNPERKPLVFGGGILNPVTVQYFRKDITVLYNEAKASEQEATVFAKAVVEEYLRLRHPYMKYILDGNVFTETSTGHQIAVIG